MNLAKDRYRVVTDPFAGFEAQVWRWWWPFWAQINWINTSPTLEKAIELCRRHKGIERHTSKALWEGDFE